MCDTVWYDIAVELIYRCVILDKPITTVSNNKLWSLHDDHIMVAFCEYILENAIYCAWKNFYEDGKSCESYKWQNSENNELINIGPHATNLMKDVMDKKIFEIDKSALQIFLCCSRDFDTLQDIFSVSPGLWNKIDQIDPECILYFEGFSYWNRNYSGCWKLNFSSARGLFSDYWQRNDNRVSERWKLGVEVATIWHFSELDSIMGQLAATERTSEKYNIRKLLFWANNIKLAEIWQWIQLCEMIGQNLCQRTWEIWE